MVKCGKLNIFQGIKRWFTPYSTPSKHVRYACEIMQKNKTVAKESIVKSEAVASLLYGAHIGNGIMGNRQITYFLRREKEIVNKISGIGSKADN